MSGDGGPTPEPLRGPSFGSYAADDVGWLLTDLSGVVLEAPTAEREEAVQNGGAHYAESLPVEYRPDAAYLDLYRHALATAAPRVAHAVGSVAEQVLARRGPDVVLASLARAGTPVAILLRRWAAVMHGLDLPHYAVSIVRGRGIDRLALAHLAAHHDPARVQFVDGWTGKGVIAGELAAALRSYRVDTAVRFDPELAVLADPGRCVTLFGTREDWLVPSACLNSTVSGLVSRTVLNARLIGPGRYHGAKFYSDLAADDVSTAFVDTITERFPDVADRVRSEPNRPRPAPDDAGLNAVQQIVRVYDIGDVNLVKPGVGETIRVLLRRVPWKVLTRAGAPAADLAPVRMLAARRGVPVEEVEDLPYTCVGLIHPRFSRGATGADGRAVGR
ncbi:MAG: cysteine protease StiP family protein [Pseudonocardia sp.]|nr:cysteine protease StiP family protein [Pseudonocardia sp.]